MKRFLLAALAVIREGIQDGPLGLDESCLALPQELVHQPAPGQAPGKQSADTAARCAFLQHRPTGEPRCGVSLPVLSHL